MAARTTPTPKHKHNKQSPGGTSTLARAYAHCTFSSPSFLPPAASCPRAQLPLLVLLPSPLPLFRRPTRSSASSAWVSWPRHGPKARVTQSSVCLVSPGIPARHSFAAPSPQRAAALGQIRDWRLHYQLVAVANMSTSDEVDPRQFLERMRTLSDQTDREDAERVKKLEEELIQGRSERLARRAGMSLRSNIDCTAPAENSQSTQNVHVRCPPTNPPRPSHILLMPTLLNPSKTELPICLRRPWSRHLRSLPVTTPSSV